jgi:hypothetical protein
MPPSFFHAKADDHFYHVTPDEVDGLVVDLKAAESSDLEIRTYRQHAGRCVYALTFDALAYSSKSKKKLFISRPHAHEPAGTAACTEFIKVLAGYGEYSKQNIEWREWALEHFVITFVADANPGGSQRAPVKFWDGSEIPNEQFFRWMFGESGENPGERFPRVDSWDMREVTPPALLGIAYEQVDEYTYVEPNRDHRSTFFRSFFESDDHYQYDVLLDLHQTEYVNSDRNAHIALPTVYDTLPEKMREQCLSLGKAIHARWVAEGASPYDEPMVPYKNNQIQRDFLAKVWAPISQRILHLITEVQNNNLRTPVGTQVRLQMAAIHETMLWMDKEI